MPGNLRIHMPIHLNDIRPTVIVVIHESAAPRHILIVDANPGSKCHITESPIAIVVVKVAGIVCEIRLEEIEPTLRIEDPNASPHTALHEPTLALSISSNRRNVRKDPVVII